MQTRSWHRLFWAAGTIALLLVFHELLLLPDGKLHVHFLDVGQGDATFLITPSGKQILVDGGPDMSVLEHLGIYMPFFDRSIDLVVLTHPHSDHLAALPEVLRRYSVENILLAGTEAEASRYEMLLDEMREQKIPVHIADPSQNIDMGDGVLLDVLWPTSQNRDTSNLNNASVVIRALFSDQSVLLAGDIEEEAEQELLRTGAGVRSAVLKVPHHGSDTSSSPQFLLAASPSQGIISVGKQNHFGHPSPSTIAQYESLHIPLLQTRDRGTISLEFAP